MNEQYEELYTEIRAKFEELERKVEYIKFLQEDTDEEYAKYLTGELPMRRIEVPIELSEGAKIPEYKTPYSAGADLYALLEDDCILIPPKQRVAINTGIKLQLPLNSEGQIRPRSGLAFRNGLECVIGTIDGDYRGEIMILLYNLSDKEQVVNNGDRVAQIVFNGAGGLFQAEFVRVDNIENNTERGENGFGSTGLK